MQRDLSSVTHLVTEEVDLGETFRLDVPQRVGLVPAYRYGSKLCQCFNTRGLASVHTSRKDVEGDLTTDGVGQAEMGEFLLEDFDKLGSNAVFLEA